MPKQQGNGRNVVPIDENWRPQDDYTGQRGRRGGSAQDEDRYRFREREERSVGGYGAHWEDREERDDRWQSPEHEQMGARGMEERAFQSRNRGYPGSFEDRWRDRGPDDRFGGRGGYGSRWDADRGGGVARGYGYYDGDWPNPGTGGSMPGYGGGTYDPRMFGRGGYPTHRGKGPAGFQRSDERIRELVCEALTDDPYVDATSIEVTVIAGEVVLAGVVDDRQQKRAAEDCVECVAGVKDVQNQIRASGEKKVSESEFDKRRRS